MSAVAFNLYKPQSTCCVVVGLGLVGQSIVNYLGFYGERLTHKPEVFLWNSSDEIACSINHLMQRSGCEKLELMWSGGRAGFTATNDEMAEE